MKILEKILWAVDFDCDHDHSLKEIGKLITLFGNEVVLLHVLPNNLKNSSFQHVVERSVKGELKKLKKELSGACGHKVAAKFVYGNIVDGVLDEAEKEDVNLILVNTGTSDPDSPQTLGLNAQKIIRTARKPVGVITEDAPGATNKLVCPVDNSEASGIALRSAILTAKKLDFKLSVISVYEPLKMVSPRMLNTGVDVEAENEKRFEQFRTDFEEFLSGVDFLGLDYEKKLLRGIPQKEIVKFARDARILYMGSTGKSGLRRAWIGSVTEKVTQEVPCSMIVSKYEEIYKLRISTEMDDIEQHFKRGNDLAGLGYYTEALEQYKMCLQINDMHLPSIRALSDLYAKIGNKSQHSYYQKLGKTLLTKLVNRQIEEEVRKRNRV